MKVEVVVICVVRVDNKEKTLREVLASSTTADINHIRLKIWKNIHKIAEQAEKTLIETYADKITEKIFTKNQ